MFKLCDFCENVVERGGTITARCNECNFLSYYENTGNRSSNCDDCGDETYGYFSWDFCEPDSMGALGSDMICDNCYNTEKIAQTMQEYEDLDAKYS